MDGRICAPEEEIDLCEVWGPPPVVIDDDVVLPCEWECMKICCDMTIGGRWNGPSRDGNCDQTLRIYCGTITIADRLYMAHSGDGIGTLIIEGTAVVNSTSGSSSCFRTGDNGGQARVIIRGNATVNLQGGWRAGDASGNWTCISFGGDCYVTVGEYLRIGDDGAGEIHIDGGTIIVKHDWFGQNGRGGTDFGPSSMSAGEVYVERHFSVVQQKVNATFDMSGGVINARDFDVCRGGSDGNGTLTMTGGLIIARENFNCPRSGDGAIAHTQLDGGEIRCDNLSLPAGGTIDIMGGKLVIAGNKLEQIRELVCFYGRITAIGSPTAVSYRYDAEKDETVVFWDGTIPDPLAAVCPVPADGSLAKCSSGVCLMWAGTHGIRDKHAVYFSEDRECVENADPECMLGLVPASRPPLWCVPPERLALWTTYYWRIVEIYYGGPTIQGPVWSFTCGCYPIKGDFNNDCVVNWEDWAILAESWGKKEYWPKESP
jgi:hypothetical protein